MIKSFIKKSASYGVINAFTAILGLFTFPLFTKYLSVDEFGLISLIASIIGMITGLLQLGIPTAMQRFYFEKSENKIFVLSTSLILTVFLNFIPVLIIIFLLRYAGHLINHELTINYTYAITLSLFTIPLSAIKVIFTDIQRIKFNFSKYALFVIVHTVSNIFFSLFFLIYLNRGVNGIFEGQLIGLSLSTLIIFFIEDKKLLFNFSGSLAKRLIRFGFPFIFVNISMIFFATMDKWLLAYFHSNTEVGLYSSATSISKIAIFINTAVSMAWAPFALDLFENDKEYKTKIVKTFDFIFWASSLIFCILIIFSKEILTLLTPETYWDSSTSSTILTLAVLTLLTHQVLALGISFEKKTKLISIGWFWATVLNLLLNLILIPYFGHTGASFSTTTCYFFISYYYFLRSQSLHFMPISMSKISYVFIYSIILTLIVNFLDQVSFSNFQTLLLLKFCLVFVFILLIHLTGLITNSQVVEGYRFILNNLNRLKP